MSQTYHLGPCRIQTPHCNYFEATGTQDGKKYFLELSASRVIDFESLVSLKNDYELSNYHNLPHVLKAHEIIRQESNLGVVKDSFNGQSLLAVLDKSALPIPEFLDLAIKLTTCIGEIHAQGIIHRDISPASFFISDDNKNNVLLSFLGNATTISIAAQRHDQSIVDQLNPGYMSPEQTGRMNRSVDYRTDIYSLGVTFYKLITGKLPFEGELSEIIHAHIARTPIEPHVINRSVPPIISEFILRMMSKNAENRYQSAAGLISDIKEIKERILSKTTSVKMELGKADHFPKLLISEKLYGREKEISTLLSTFEQSKNGQVQALLIAGYSGIGKTRLINEIHKPIVRQNGYFVSGKYDQYQKDSPYTAFGQAFGSLIRYIIAQGTEIADPIAEKLKKALAGNGALLAEIIPGLELLIGPQGQSYKLGFIESKARFLQVFEKFVSVLATKEHPLVLFIDDLQWADSGSLELCEYLLTCGSIQNMVIIGAYRDNEVNTSHPLMMIINRVKENDPDLIKEIFLKELSEYQVNELIADSLHHLPTKTLRLTELIMRKSQGNPFFIKEFLEKIEQEKLLYFDDAKKEWDWDESSISKLSVSDNVVDLVETKIRKLSKDGQYILSMASCLGNTFDFNTLSLISEFNESRTAELLWENVQGGFIYPLSRWNKHYKDEIWQELGLQGAKNQDIRFQFNHDRIQQAAYSLIPTEHKKNTHLLIGRLLYSKFAKTELEDHLFDMINHFNSGIDLINDASEKNQLAILNHRAGEKAKNSNAYQPALFYFKSGLDLLHAETTNVLYKDLLYSRAEAEYLCGNFEESENIFDMAIDKAAGAIDKASVYANKMQLYENTQRHLKAIEVAQKGLALLGIDLPIDPSQMQVMTELLKVKFKLRGKSIDTLYHATDMQDPALQLAMRILMNLWGPAYLLQKQNLLVYFILKMINYSVSKGNSKESALAYAFYGYVLSAQLKDYKTGYDFSRLGIRLNEKFNDSSLRSKVYVIADGCVSHWRNPFIQALPGLRIAYEAGIEVNDIIYAGYALSFTWRCHFYSAENLESISEKIKVHIHFSRKVHSPLILHFYLVVARVTAKLLDSPLDQELFQDMLAPEVQLQFMTDWAEKDKVMLPLVLYYIQEGTAAYIFNDFESSLNHLNLALPILPAMLGLAENAEQLFYHSLSILAVLKTRKLNKNERHLSKLLKQNCHLMQKWAEHAPANYGARFELIEAELAVLDGDSRKAHLKYAQAVKQARIDGMLYISGIANERWAEFEFKLGVSHQGQALIREAWYDYRNWGAHGKVKRMENTYAFLLHTNEKQEQVKIRNTGNRIDLNSIIKATNSISGEVVYDKLLKTLLDIVIENAGAQIGCIIAVDGNELVIEAHADASISNGSNTRMKKSLGDSNNIAQSVVRFVYKTKEAVIMDNASLDMRFYQDVHIRHAKPLSLLCIPIMRNNAVTAILYLENNLASGVFTQDRLEILNLLSGQIAISLQNATLYENLELKVKERTSTIEKQKLLIEAEKEKSDKLLLNILPSEIAEELKTSGTCAPRHYEQVTILFTDFQGFSMVSKQMDADALVNMLDECFIEFDRITQNHGLEKIKTIGDAYMAVCGLPNADPEHALNALRAGIDIIHFIDKYCADRQLKGLPYCPIRVGIHSGPVIAGIVGHQKFAFDIWGDTVNIASRIESSGENGKINISQSTYDLISDHYHCSYRGKISVKHNDEIEMYFVDL